MSKTIQFNFTDYESDQETDAPQNVTYEFNITDNPDALHLERHFYQFLNSLGLREWS